MYPTQAKFNRQTVPKTMINFSSVFTMGKLLGAGAFGQVYQVIDKQSRKSYAIKVLKTVDQDTIKEIEMLIELSKNKLVNKDIVHYYDHFLYNNTFCVLMEFIDGQQADNYFKRNQFNLQKFINFSTWLVDIVKRLHSLNIVHRDIKPANILITKNTYKLIDFGLSCRLTKKPSLLTCQANVAGTPLFLAPEILSGKYRQNLDKYYKSADIYATGAALYYILSGGKTPYLLNQRAQIISSRYRPIALRSNANQLNYIFQHMVAMNPDLRWNAQQSLQAFRNLR